MKATTLTSMLVFFVSCASIERDPHPKNIKGEIVRFHDVDYGADVTTDKKILYFNFSCFDGPKTGRIYTTLAKDIEKILGLLYGLESVYNMSYTVYNENTVIREKMELVSTPQVLNVEVAYCYYQSWRDRFTELDKVNLMYMSVRLR